MSDHLRGNLLDVIEVLLDLGTSAERMRAAYARNHSDEPALLVATRDVTLMVGGSLNEIVTYDLAGDQAGIDGALARLRAIADGMRQDARAYARDVNLPPPTVAHAPPRLQ